jgi:hypothetical protein
MRPSSMKPREAASRQCFIGRFRSAVTEVRRTNIALSGSKQRTGVYSVLRCLGNQKSLESS